MNVRYAVFWAYDAAGLIPSGLRQIGIDGTVKCASYWHTREEAEKHALEIAEVGSNITFVLPVYMPDAFGDWNERTDATREESLRHAEHVRAKKAARSWWQRFLDWV